MVAAAKVAMERHKNLMNGKSISSLHKFPEAVTRKIAKLYNIRSSLSIETVIRDLTIMNQSASHRNDANYQKIQPSSDKLLLNHKLLIIHKLIELNSGDIFDTFPSKQTLLVLSKGCTKKSGIEAFLYILRSLIKTILDFSRRNRPPLDAE